MVATKGHKDENLVKEVPEFVSLSNDNRTLNFHPFSSSEYSSEIHASTYKCIAKNKAGIIASPEIDLRAGTFFKEIIILQWQNHLQQKEASFKCQYNIVRYSGWPRIRAASISRIRLRWKYSGVEMFDPSICKAVHSGHLMDVGKRCSINQHSKRYKNQTKIKVWYA